MAETFLRLVRKSAKFDRKRFGSDVDLFEVSLGCDFAGDALCAEPWSVVQRKKAAPSTTGDAAEAGAELDFFKNARSSAKPSAASKKGAPAERKRESKKPASKAPDSEDEGSEPEEDEAPSSEGASDSTSLVWPDCASRLLPV